MAYCTQCGNPITEGESHDCTAQELAATATVAQKGEFVIGSYTLNNGVLLKLLKNPYSSLQLDPTKDILYGVLGMVVSVLGFFLWALALQKGLVDAISSALGGLDFFGVGSTIKKKVSIAPNALLIGLVSMIGLLAILGAVGNWLGTRKAGIKEIVTYLGAMQLTFGVGYIVAAILLFVSIKFSLFLLMIGLLTTLLSTVMASHDIHSIARDKRMPAITVSLTGYIVGVGVIYTLFA